MKALAIEAGETADVLALAALDRRCYTSPWTPRHFLEALRDRAQRVLVLRDPRRRWDEDRGLEGYCVVAVAADEVEVHNLAVRPERRRHGLARLLLEVALSWAARRGARTALLEVRAGNAAALGLYRACGFEVVGARRGYYQDPPEDAVLMRREGLGGAPKGPAREP